MALKPDEEFVKDSLSKFLGAKKAWEGEDPPDIYLDINDEKIAVEITRLSPVSFDKNGCIQNRNSQDHFALNLCNDLNEKLGDKVPQEIDLSLILTVPVQYGRKYKKALYAFVNNLITEELVPGSKEEVVLEGSKVKVSVMPNRHHSSKKIVGAIVNKNSSADILSNAQVTLADRIQDKVFKCREISSNYKIWLAFYNDYWIADHQTYVQALESLDIDHYFEKMYVVMDTGTVHEIYQK